MAAKPSLPKPQHSAIEFDLEPLDNEADMFKWFLLSLLFSKPIRSSTAIKTWRIFLGKGLDTPWAIADASDYELVWCLHDSGYTRYQHLMARTLHTCMRQLIEKYDGSLFYILDICRDEDEFSKQLQKLYGVDPKTAEIFMRETEEYFARRAE